jgi:N-acylglucosamine-6-phosphate 2-epimerase
MDKGIIVSCQSESGSSFNNTQSIVNFTIEAERGGAVGLRLRNTENVFEVNKVSELPIIGLTKSNYENGDVWITPSWTQAKHLKDVGSDYVAMDATGRGGYYDIELASTEGLINVIGDISHINQAEEALKNGCKMLTTALSGYTSNCQVDMDKPDYILLYELIKNFPDVLIMAEGRYWEKDDVKKAFDMGANNVVIGTAITRPHLITKRYVEAYDE